MLKGSCHCARVTWTPKTSPQPVTACNCSICRRYGTLWAYGHIDHDIHVTGLTTPYRRSDSGIIDFHFCQHCGCVTHYISIHPDRDGRRWSAVNVRLTELEPIQSLPIDHFDGHETFDDLPRDGRTVKDMWF